MSINEPYKFLEQNEPKKKVSERFDYTYNFKILP